MLTPEQAAIEAAEAHDKLLERMKESTAERIATAAKGGDTCLGVYVASDYVSEIKRWLEGNGYRVIYDKSLFGRKLYVYWGPKPAVMDFLKEVGPEVILPLMALIFALVMLAYEVCCR